MDEYCRNGVFASANDYIFTLLCIARLQITGRDQTVTGAMQCVRAAGGLELVTRCCPMHPPCPLQHLLLSHYLAESHICRIHMSLAELRSQHGGAAAGRGKSSILECLYYGYSNHYSLLQISFRLEGLQGLPFSVSKNYTNCRGGCTDILARISSCLDTLRGILHYRPILHRRLRVARLQCQAVVLIVRLRVGRAWGRGASRGSWRRLPRRHAVAV